MALLLRKIKERYQFYLTQQTEIGCKHRNIMVSMLELMIKEITDHPNMHRFILEVFRDMTYCHTMRRICTPNEWIRYKSEVRYLMQFLDRT